MVISVDPDETVRCLIWICIVRKDIIKPEHDKTYITACVPSEDSDQSGHPPSQIRVFAVRMKKACP